MTETTSQRVLRYAEAAALVEEHATRSLESARAQERLSLLEARERVLAEPIIADRDQPPFPRATRDGFACRAQEANRNIPLAVASEMRAGADPSAMKLNGDDAIEIMTGAALPAGADCVVMIEHVELDRGAKIVRPQAGRSWSAGENVVPQGAEARQGSIVVSAGVRLSPPQIGAAAACGYAQVQVWQRPRVAILATGDELVAMDRQPLPYQIRNSNSYSLAAQVSAAGGQPEILPVAPDELEATRRSLEKASGFDLLLLSGGVSMGRYDVVEQALAGLGAEFFFTGVKMQPGRPVVFGRLPGGPYFFGLPGNPVSTIVTFSLFARPLLGGLGGESSASPRFADAVLQKAVNFPQGLTRFLPARLTGEAVGATVHILPWQGSGDLAAAASANCFVVIPEDTPALPVGSRVTIAWV